MKDRIDLLEEIVATDPATKVFFPLAEHYVDENRFDEAVRTLNRGLDRHPDHIQARLLLVDLYDRMGEDHKALEEVRFLAVLLSRYPSFWKIWSRDETSSRDVKLAMNFLAGAFGGASFSWANIIEKGLETYASSKALSDDDLSRLTREVADSIESQDITRDIPDAPPVTAADLSSQAILEEEIARVAREPEPPSDHDVATSFFKMDDADAEIVAEYYEEDFDHDADIDLSDVEDTEDTEDTGDTGDTEDAEDAEETWEVEEAPASSEPFAFSPEDLAGEDIYIEEIEMDEDEEEEDTVSSDMLSPGMDLENFEIDLDELIADQAGDSGHKPPPDEGNIRTKTMADVLATQGDYQGALEIYQDLWISSPPGEQRDELEQRIKNMQEHLGEDKTHKPKARPKSRPGVKAETPEPEPAPEAGESEGSGMNDKDRLLSTLERLADRLDQRASG